MLAILNFLNAHNLPIFQPILMILVSKFMVHRTLSDKRYLLLGLLSHLKERICSQRVQILSPREGKFFPLKAIPYGMENHFLPHYM